MDTRTDGHAFAICMQFRTIFEFVRKIMELQESDGQKDIAKSTYTVQ